MGEWVSRICDLGHVPGNSCYGTLYLPSALKYSVGLVKGDGLSWPCCSHGTKEGRGV